MFAVQILKKTPKNNKQPKPNSQNVPNPFCWRNTNTEWAQKHADQRKYMYSSISHQLHALILEYWAGNMVWVCCFFFIFLISHFVLLYFQKHPVKKWEWQKESLKVSKEVPLWLMQGFALRNRKPNLKPTFQIRQSMDGMLSGLGEQLWCLEVAYQIFFPMCWSFLCLFHCYQNPMMLYFSTALQD